jgi:6-phosphogluconolactonase
MGFTANRHRPVPKVQRKSRLGMFPKQPAAKRGGGGFMTMRVRASLTLIVAVAMLGLASCDHYNCGSGASFGSGCTATGSGLGTTGGGTGGTGSALALAYYVSNNEVGSLELSNSGSTTSLLDTPSFVLPTLPSGYTNSAMVIAQEQFLYVPYSSTSSAAAIYAWTIDATTGALTALTPLTLTDVAGLASASQATTPLITDPTGSFLYMADATDSRIDVFQIDPTSGVLTLLFQTSTSIPPWNLSTDGLGRYLYVTQGSASGEGVTMEVFSINSTTGALSGGTTMAFNMWQVQGEPTGLFMIGVDGETGLASNTAFDPNVYVFSIGSNGVLTQVGKYATASGNGPTSVAVSPNGSYVYDFSVNISSGFDGALDGFTLTSGVLTPLAGSPFTTLSTPPDGGHFDQSGAYLFIHASSAIGFFSIDPTTGLPSEPNSPVGVGSGAVIYPWAVTDPQ